MIQLYITVQMGTDRHIRDRQTHMGQRETHGTVKHIWDRHTWDRHTYGTNRHMGQTHIWDRHTYGTDTHGL